MIDVVKWYLYSTRQLDTLTSNMTFQISVLYIDWIRIVWVDLEVCNQLWIIRVRKERGLRCMNANKKMDIKEWVLWLIDEK